MWSLIVIMAMSNKAIDVEEFAGFSSYKMCAKTANQIVISAKELKPYMGVKTICAQKN